MFSISTTSIIVFFIYIAAMIFVGYLAMRRTKSYNDYIIGGRSLGPVVTALSAGASDMSGWLLLGLPGAVYASGLIEGWIAIGLTIGAYINWRIVAGRLRAHTEVLNAVTLPVFFYKRYDNSDTLKIASAITNIVFFTVYSASGMVAGALIFEFLFGIPYEYALIYGAIATIIYILMGGFLGVSWTDTIQGTLMLFVLIVSPIIVIFLLGGLNETNTLIKAAGVAKEVNFTKLWDGNFVGWISLMAWGLGYFGQPHILARFMAARTVGSIKTARRISVSWMILCLAGAVAIGYFGIAYFAEPNAQYSELVNSHNERILIGLSAALFHPIVLGVVLSAILAAVMSTLSSQLLLASTSVTEDIYAGYINKNATPALLLWMSRVFVLVISLIAIFIASDRTSTVLGVVSFAWAGFGAAFGPLVICSVFCKNVTKQGAIAGVLLGAIVVFAWKQAGLGSIMYEIVPGFIISTLAIVLVSKFTKPISVEAQNKFTEAEKIYQEQKNVDIDLIMVK